MVHVVNHHLLLLEDSQVGGIVLILQVLNDLSQDEHFGALVVEELFKLGGALLQQLVLLLKLLLKNRGSTASLLLIALRIARRNQGCHDLFVGIHNIFQVLHFVSQVFVLLGQKLDL